MRRIVERLAYGMALLGGAVLTCLIILICVSVLGRSMNTILHGWFGQVMPGFSSWALGLGIGPINGDFEIVEAGVAFAIFAFLPICQLTSGHAVVDILTSNLSPRINRFLSMVTEILFAAVLLLIAVQLYQGTMSKFRFGENTFILQFPVWWGYAASLVAAAVAAIVGLYIAATRVRDCVTGKETLL
ncbi:TRAP transporter small permease [Ruegeria halocynthiae]|uniref:TRAP transporter small permease n=1 Tax=Ruegeria halocynthiae TaxID=985054 RepID=UPI000568F02E|nr:TRAP transporter small permease subunit [Ruegeria halocynthiae]